MILSRARGAVKGCSYGTGDRRLTCSFLFSLDHSTCPNNKPELDFHLRELKTQLLTIARFQLKAK